MKDYIYLDMNLANSYLAQIDKGILKKIVNGEALANTNQENGGDTISSEGGGSLGIPGVINSNGKMTKTEFDTFSTISSKNSSELIETVLDDYAIDLLINKLREKRLIDSLRNSSEGDFVLINVPFKFYDFEFMQKSLNDNFFKAIGINNNKNEEIKGIEELLKEYDKKIKIYNQPKKKNKLSAEQLQEFKKIKSQKNELSKELEKAKESIDIFSMFKILSEFGDSLFPNSVILSHKGYLAYCNRHNMRISQAQLSAISDSKRNICILANISNVKENVNKDGQINDFQTIDLNILPSLFSELLLGNFNLLESGDRILRPIAIYFDQE
ncbi:hypothetical protein Q3E60_10120 [Enterococcus faecium]|nr:hypothetical protein [Enterococcus hirae]MDQ8229682.1 hypothetical protein [Enterococcus faecium]MDQ8251911.1 hypothetical protein [Enterococcus faecium]MDQ8303996.1 hypothetical protein [Enterococcus faecium]MDQ8428098.1 hypothetical protein [Enterococcus faecium]